MRSLGPLLLLLVLLAAACGAALSSGSKVPQGREVYRQTMRGVAWVRTADGAKGTGWLADRRRRLLVTSFHVVGDSDTADIVFPVLRDGRIVHDRAYYLENYETLRQAGHVIRGKVLSKEPHTDLALLQLESVPPDVVELPLGAGGARPGERVHVVGCRYDSDVLWVYTAGIVRQAQTLREGYFNAGRQLAKGARVLLAQAPINEGDSGAPLVNSRGEVVGVTAAVAWEAQGSGLFIDVGHVRALLKTAARSPTDESAPAAAIYQQALRSMVLVQATSTEKRATGFVIDVPRRLALTSMEAIGKREAVAVTFPDRDNGRVIGEAAYYRDHQRLKTRQRMATGVVLARDHRRNVALLEMDVMPQDCAASRLGGEAEPGDALHILSNPARLEAVWVYTAAWTRQTGQANLGQTGDGPDPRVLLVQAPLPEGEGGGPVLNERGTVVAILSGKSSPQQQICYCLTAAEIQSFVNESRRRWQPRTEADHRERGEQFTKARQYRRAIASFDVALQVDPRSARALAGRGRAWLLAGDGGRALADCDAALVLDGNLAAGYCNRAEVWCRRGAPSRAIADCEAALKGAPRQAMAFAIRGLARGMLGDLAAGIADCNEAIWFDSKLLAAYLNRGRLHARKGDFVAAIADFTHVAHLDDQHAEAFRDRADAHWARHDVTAALADYMQATALAPDDVLAQRGRGCALAARGDDEAAVAVLTEALRLSPHDGVTWFERGKCRLRTGDRQGGLADLGRSLRLQPHLLGHVLQEILGLLSTPIER